MFYEFIEFRSTVVKPYYRISIGVNGDTAVASNDEQMFSDEEESPNDQKKVIDQSSELHDTKINAATPSAITLSADALNAAASSAPNRAESEETSQSSSSIKRGRGRLRKQSIIQLKNQPDLLIFLSIEIDSSASSPRTPYAESRRKEINGLLNKGVFDVLILTEVPRGVRLFNFRFVDKIKNPRTSAAFEKSRLMVQAFNDRGKEMVIIQSLTIQRMNQRLILVLAAIIGHELYFWDIFQAYVQSAISLTREFYIRSSVELGLKLDHVLKMIKSLYGVSEAGVH